MVIAAYNPDLARPRHKVTVRDVATASGVSVPAVYQAVNGSGKLSSVTRRRILQKAREMGLTLNAAAKAVRTGTFGGIAILTGGEKGRPTLSSRILRAVQSETHARDLHLSVASLTDVELTDTRRVPKLLREFSVDGLLIDLIADVPDVMIRLIEKHQLPSIWMNVNRPFDSIFPDDRDAARRATEAMIQRGHRQIAFVMTAVSKHYSLEDRRGGYLDAMHAAGLPARLLEPGELLSPADRAAYHRHWLRREDRPTAVLCYEHYEVLPVMWEALQSGLQVPRDLSVMYVSEGSDQSLGFTLSMMRIPQYEIGRRAVERLVQKIQSPTQSLAPLAIPLEFIEGDTLAQPA